MHLGNVYAALVSWLSVRSRGGRWILRIEDLDPQRSRLEYARMIEDDLRWLGLDWDEGGVDDIGPNAPYCQSRREAFYQNALNKIVKQGLTYSCHCRRADIMATQAPHQSDGRIVYAGTCRPDVAPPFETVPDQTPHATRIYVPDRTIAFDDDFCGHHEVNLLTHCGDFVLRRADGAWAYQLAVVVDDAMMGVSEVVRGNDLLLSTAQQLYLYEVLGYTPPRWKHIPLLVNASNQRLSKRDQSLSMDVLRQHYSPTELLGYVAGLTGLADTTKPVTADELVRRYNDNQIPRVHSIKV